MEPEDSGLESHCVIFSINCHLKIQWLWLTKEWQAEKQKGFSWSSLGPCHALLARQVFPPGLVNQSLTLLLHSPVITWNSSGYVPQEHDVTRRCHCLCQGVCHKSMTSSEDVTAYGHVSSAQILITHTLILPNWILLCAKCCMNFKPWFLSERENVKYFQPLMSWHFSWNSSNSYNYPNIARHLAHGKWSSK